MTTDDPQDDVQPIVPFDAVTDERWKPSPAALVVGALWIVGVAALWRPLLVPSLTLVVATAVFAAFPRANASARQTLGRVELWAWTVAFLAAAGIAYVSGFELRDLEAPDDLYSHAGAAYVGASAALFTIGAAVAFLLRRPACVAGQARRSVVDVEFAMRCVGGGVRRAFQSERAWLVFGTAMCVSIGVYLMPWADRGRTAFFFPWGVALGWFCGGRVAVAFVLGAVVAAWVDPRLESGRNLGPFIALVGTFGGALGAVAYGFARARAAHVRLAGQERIRLEIGGLGTRLERMTPRTERQFSGPAFCMSIVVASAIAYACMRTLPSGVGPTVDVATSVGVGVVLAVAAVSASTTVGPGLVIAFGSIAMLPGILPAIVAEWAAWVPPRALAVTPCAMVGAGVATLVQQVGARIGVTPLRSQRIVLAACAAAMFVVWASTLWHASPSPFAGEAVDATGLTYFEHRSDFRDEEGVAQVPATIAMVGAFGAEVCGLPGIVAALGFAFGWIHAVWVGLGAIAASVARRRGLDADTVRDLGVVIVGAELLAMIGLLLFG